MTREWLTVAVIGAWALLMAWAVFGEPSKERRQRRSWRKSATKKMPPLERGRH